MDFFCPASPLLGFSSLPTPSVSRDPTCPSPEFQFTAGPPEGTEGPMDIDRRRLLATVAGVGLTGLIGAYRKIRPAGECEGSVILQCHPFTRSLPDRGRLAGDRPDRARIERTVLELCFGME